MIPWFIDCRTEVCSFWPAGWHCFPSAVAASRIRKNTLIYGRGEDAKSLDPINTQLDESVKVIVNIFDTLITYDDETVDLVPSLAKTFHAQAVVFSFERIGRSPMCMIRYGLTVLASAKSGAWTDVKQLASDPTVC